MPDARYTLFVPTVDNLQNPLIPVAQYAHQWLFQTYGNQGSYVDPGKIGLWRDDAPETYDHLVTVAEETPEFDSAIKQLAAYIAEVCNQWGVFCTKEGKHGITRWEISNPEFRPGEAAEDEVLADPQNAIRVDPSQAKAVPADFGNVSQSEQLVPQ